MSKIGISLKIDVTKIDKARLFAGKKGTYLDATVFVDDKQDEFGNNGMISQSVSKEERDSGVVGAILGNCKVFWSEDARNAAHVQGHEQVTQTVSGPVKTHTPPPAATDSFDDDIPFS